MASSRDLARDYASRIRKAASLRKQASLDESLFRDGLSDEVLRILNEIDGLTFEGSGRPIDAASKERLYRELDDELGIAEGDFEQIKEASVSSAVRYEAYLSALLQSLGAR